MQSAHEFDKAVDSIHKDLKLFNENKMCKDNVWSTNIIDSFSKLTKKHNNIMSNLQIAGLILEASTKVYSLRVDSVYDDVIRMNADLSKQTIGKFNNNALRTGLHNGRICVLPMESAEEAGMSIRQKENDLNNNQTILGGKANLQFDIDVDVKPIKIERSVIDFGDMDAQQLPQVDEKPDFAKDIDMKQCVLNLISRKDPSCFSEILRDLPKVQSNTMQENMSTGLAFSAILHLCNEKGLSLTAKEDLTDFKISNTVN